MLSVVEASRPRRQIVNEDERKGRVGWFDGYVTALESVPRRTLPLRCPCCYCRTQVIRADFHICPVCFWEDDGQDDHDADVVRGGPNGPLSLTAARANYRAFGACDERARRHVREPLPEEAPE